MEGLVNSHTSPLVLTVTLLEGVVVSETLQIFNWRVADLNGGTLPFKVSVAGGENFSCRHP